MRKEYRIINLKSQRKLGYLNLGALAKAVLLYNLPSERVKSAALTPYKISKFPKPVQTSEIRTYSSSLKLPDVAKAWDRQSPHPSVLQSKYMQEEMGKGVLQRTSVSAKVWPLSVKEQALGFVSPTVQPSELSSPITRPKEGIQFKLNLIFSRISSGSSHLFSVTSFVAFVFDLVVLLVLSLLLHLFLSWLVFTLSQCNDYLPCHACLSYYLWLARTGPS